jgi:hypothetical protein
LIQRPSRRRAKQSFELFLFSIDPDLIRRVVAGGARGVIVDWEYAGKRERQKGVDTQINRQDVADLLRVRRSTDALVICRINGYGVTTPAEIEQAVDAGADEILLPMVESVDEVEAVLSTVDDRCGVGVLIETIGAMKIIPQLARMSLARVMLGLIDLSIQRETSNIFEPVVDGTIEYIRSSIDVPFGWGGLTLPERGHPIPCRLLIAEMVRLRSDFSFLRRSFHRDVEGLDPSSEVARLLRAIEDARSRPPDAVARDAQSFRDAVASMSDGLARSSPGSS